VAIRRLMERLRGREAGIGLQSALDQIVDVYLGPNMGPGGWPISQVQRRRVAARVAERMRHRTGRDYRMEAALHLAGSSIEVVVMRRPGVKSKHVVAYEVNEKDGHRKVRVLRLHRMTGKSILWDRKDGRPIRCLVEMEDWSSEGEKEGGTSFEVPFQLLTRTCARDRLERVLASVGRQQPRRRLRPFVLVNVRKRDEWMDTDALRDAWKRVPIEYMPVPSETALRRVKQMTELLTQLPGGSIRELDNMFEGKGRRHINATITAMQWMCACQSNTISAPGNVLMLKSRYVGGMIQPPILAEASMGARAPRMKQTSTRHRA